MTLTHFTDTDTKLLITLCTEMTSTDACLSAGLSYPYGIKRIGHLKKHGWLIARQDGKETYYSTRLSDATEHFFAIAQTATSKGPVFRLPNFFGQSLTFIEALSQERRRTRELPLEGNVLDYMKYMMQTIRARSWRASKNLAQQVPTEDKMRDWLEQYVIQLKRTLKLAEELLNCRKLWDGSPTTWKWINEEPPSETALKQADILFDLYCKRNGK